MESGTSVEDSDLCGVQSLHCVREKVCFGQDLAVDSMLESETDGSEVFGEVLGAKVLIMSTADRSCSPEEASTGHAESSESDERNQSPTGHLVATLQEDMG